MDSWTQPVEVGETKRLGEGKVRKFRIQKWAYRCFDYLRDVIRCQMVGL